MPTKATNSRLPSEAATEIVKSRGKIYGKPGSVYGIWAHLCAPIIARMIMENRSEMTPEEASMVLIQLKCAREINAQYPKDYRDNVDDIAGYANVLHLTKEDARAPS